MQRSPVLLLALAVGAWSLVRIWALRHLGRTRDWQMLEAHKGNLRLGTHNESLLLRHLECNLCKLKDQTRPSKSLKEFRPTRQARWVKQKTRDTTQYKIVIVYIFKKKKKLTFGSSPLQEEGWIGRNRTGSYAGGKSGTNRWAILGWEVFPHSINNKISFSFLFALLLLCVYLFF